MTQSASALAIPPGPSEPLDITFNQHALSQLCAAFARYGEVFRVYSPVTQAHIYVFSHPDHVRRLLVDNHQNYTKGIGIERVGILLGNGIMISEGELWSRQRRMIQPAFHRDIIARMVGHIRTANPELLNKWVGCAKNRQEINVTQDMSDVTLNIILRSIFGDGLAAMGATQGANPFTLLTAETNRNLLFEYKFISLSQLIMSCVTRRRAQATTKRVYLLAMLMDARDRKSGEPMPDKQLLDEIMTLIVAGHETTASALNWFWYLLSQYPEVVRRLHEEVDRLAVSPVTADEVVQRTYTRQVVEETLRLYPPGWLLTRARSTLTALAAMRSHRARTCSSQPTSCTGIPPTGQSRSASIRSASPRPAQRSATGFAICRFHWGRAPVSASISP